MNKYRIVFSPTGGTEKVTKTITKFWNEVKDVTFQKQIWILVPFHLRKKT